MELIICPICARIIHRHDATPIAARARVGRGGNPSALLYEMALDLELTHQERIHAAEEACAAHYRKRHPVRLWLWRKTHWAALMNKRWLFWGQQTWAERFDYSQV